MKRTIATLGVVGLGVMGATVAAYAAPPTSSDAHSIIICHAKGGSGSFTAVEVSVNGLSGHSGHADDVVPQNNGDTLPGGQNLTPGNLALLAQGCEAGGAVTPSPSPTTPATDEPTTPATDEPTTPATDEPTTPATQQPTTPAVTVVVPPASTPAASTPSAVIPAAGAPAAVTPGAAAPQGAAAAVPAAGATNVGYNVQTAVGRSDAGIPQWLAALTGFFGTVGAWVLVKSGLRLRGSNG